MDNLTTNMMISRCSLGTCRRLEDLGQVWVGYELRMNLLTKDGEALLKSCCF